MSNRGDMEYYLEAVSVFYDEKLKFLSTKDNFLRCKGCPTDKKIKEEYDEVSLSCGGKDSEKRLWYENKYQVPSLFTL